MLTQEKLKEYALDEKGCYLKSLIAAFYLARYEERAVDCFPNAEDAYSFAFTELAEVVDAQLRLESTWDRNNAKEIDLIGEIYDTILMLLVTAISATPDKEHSKMFLEIEKALNRHPKAAPEPPIELLNAFHLSMFSNIKCNISMLAIEEDTTHSRPLSVYQKVENLSTCLLETIEHLLSHIDWAQEQLPIIKREVKGSYIEQFRQHLDRKLKSKDRVSLETLVILLKEQCLQN